MPQPISAADHRYTWVPLDPTAPPAPESAAAGAGASGASGGADAAMGAAGAGGGAVAGAAGAMGAFAGGGPAAGVYRPVSRGPHVPASHAGGSLGGSRAPSRGAAGGAGGVGGWQAVSPQRQRQGTPPVGLGPPPAGTVAGLLGYPAPNGAGGGGMGGMGAMSGGGGGGGGAGFGIVDSRLALGASQWDGLYRGSHTPAVGHPQRMAAVGPADAAQLSRRGSCSGSVAELVAEEEERWGRHGAE